jgi:hypothetical protein
MTLLQKEKIGSLGIHVVTRQKPDQCRLSGVLSLLKPSGLTTRILVEPRRKGAGKPRREIRFYQRSSAAKKVFQGSLDGW